MAVKNKYIAVNGAKITVNHVNQSDFISLTDIARFKNLEPTDTIIQNWLRNRNTIELLGFWEQRYNPNFKPNAFDGFRKQAGLNSFTLTPKQWIEKTDAIGIVSKAGKFGGTFAHKAIAFEFASWISIERGDQATLEQLVVLSNLESINAILINQSLSQAERHIQLNQVAISQMNSLLKSPTLQKLKSS